MRKRPQQQRSREMVSTLIEATARCIAERGLDNTTTGHIAELAGVSVGSLYQYFDGKEALIEALMGQLAEDTARGVSRLPLPADASLRDLVGTAIRFGFSVLHQRDGLYLELVRNWHRLPTRKATDMLQQHLMELARLHFIRHYRELPIEDLQVRMFIITNSTIFTMARLIDQDSRLLPVDAVASGLTDMVTGYLLAPAGQMPASL